MNSLTFVSTCCALRLTLNFLIVYIATNVNAGPNDYLKSSEFHKDLAVPERRNETSSWLPDFHLTTRPKESLRLRKRPKRETSESRDENRSEDIADEKSEWGKQMEEISREKREKWKKYQTEKSESLDAAEIQTTSIKNFDNKMTKQFANTTHTTVSKINDEDQLHVLKKRSEYKIGEKDDKGQDFFPSSETENGRWQMGGKQEPDLRLLPGGFRRSKNVEGPDRVKLNMSKMSYHILNKIKFPDEDKQIGKFEKKKSKKLENLESGRKFGDRLKEIESNGKWRMIGGNEPPSEVRDETFWRKIIKNNGERETGRLSKKIHDRIVESPAKESREDIWNGRLRMSEKRPTEKYWSSIPNDKNIEGIETVERHSGPLESSEEKKTEKEGRNFIPNSESEYWINDDPKTSQGTIEDTRRTLNTQDSPNCLRNNQKFHESNSSPGIRKLIQIIISPYDAVAAAAAPPRNGIELSIDQLIPESNGVFRVAELQPIVIGLSSKVKHKRD